MKNIKLLILQVLLICISYIIPKNKKLLLFGSGNGTGFRGNTKYIYLYVKNNTKYISFWITEDKNLYKKFKDEGLNILYKYSFKGFFSMLRAKYLLIETSAKDIYYIGEIFGRFKFINLWHGIPLKQIGDDMIKSNKGLGANFKYKVRDKFGKYLKSSSKVYKYIATSKLTQELFKKAFDNDNVIITGYPRNDIFFNPSLIQSDIKDKLNLNKYDKIITYAPTFRDKNNISPFTKDFLVKLNNFCKDNNYLFILKLHPFDKSLLFDFSEYFNILQLDKSIDLQETLVYTDILITDYSSVFFDFMVTKKPIIYYSFDYDFYIKNCREMYFDYYKDIPGPFVKSEDELLELLKNINTWFNNKDYKDKYLSFIDKIHKYQDGNSSKRVFDLIINK